MPKHLTWKRAWEGRSIDQRHAFVLTCFADSARRSMPGSFLCRSLPAKSILRPSMRLVSTGIPWSAPFFDKQLSLNFVHLHLDYFLHFIDSDNKPSGAGRGYRGAQGLHSCHQRQHQNTRSRIPAEDAAVVQQAPVHFENGYWQRSSASCTFAAQHSNVRRQSQRHVKLSCPVPQRRAPMHQPPPICLLTLFQRALALSTPHTP
jgi:hypothetical protein